MYHKWAESPWINSATRSRLNSAPRQGQMAKQDGTKVLGCTTSQSDTSSLTFDWDCTKLRMLLKRRLHQVLWWSNCTNGSTVIGCVFTPKQCSGRVAECLNGSTMWDWLQTNASTNRLFTNRILCLWGVIDNVGQKPKQLLVEFDVLSRNHFCSFQRHPNWSHPILRPVARVKWFLPKCWPEQSLRSKVSKKQGAKTAQIRTLPP